MFHNLEKIFSISVWSKTAGNMSVCNMSADGKQLKSGFSIKLYIFNQGDSNSIAATSQTL